MKGYNIAFAVSSAFVLFTLFLPMSARGLHVGAYLLVLGSFLAGICLWKREKRMASASVILFILNILLIVLFCDPLDWSAAH